MTTAIAATNRETPPIRKIRPHLPWACAVTFFLTAAQGQTVFSSHFNNGSGSSGDKNSGVYHWTAAVGGGGTLDTSLAGAPASVGVSQGTTASTGVPVFPSQSTAAGFLFALPDSAPGAMFLYNTNLSTTTDFQDAPQSSWFLSGPDPLTGLTVGNIAEFAVYTRPASAGVVMRFAVLAGGQWHVSASPFTQGDLNRFEQHRPFAKNNCRNPHKRLVRPFESLNAGESPARTNFPTPTLALLRSLSRPWAAVLMGRATGVSTRSTCC